MESQDHQEVGIENWVGSRLVVEMADHQEGSEEGYRRVQHRSVVGREGKACHGHQVLKSECLVWCCLDWGRGEKKGKENEAYEASCRRVGEDRLACRRVEVAFRLGLEDMCKCFETKEPLVEQGTNPRSRMVEAFLRVRVAVAAWDSRRLGLQQRMRTLSSR